MGRYNRVFNYAKPCLNCGKKAKKKTETWYGNEPYKGNLKIISKHELYYTLWDGESYEHYCGFFCKNTCAMDFADDIVTGKLRMSYKTK